MLQRILELDDEIARPLRPLAACEAVAGLRLGAARLDLASAGWTTSARTSTTSTARPRSRGRRSPRPRTCARRPGTAGQPPRGTVVKIYDDDGQAGRGRRDRPHLRRQRPPVRGLHRRRQQGRDRRPDVLRRRRPLRRRRAPVRRRPRRRHDRLRRRERVPAARSRSCSHGHDAVAEVAVFGVDDEKFGQRLKAVVVNEEASCRRDEVKEYVKTNLAGYKVPRDVVFVDELPRTSTGKVLKRELKDD